MQLARPITKGTADHSNGVGGELTTPIIPSRRESTEDEILSTRRAPGHKVANSLELRDDNAMGAAMFSPPSSPTRSSKRKSVPEPSSEIPESFEAVMRKSLLGTCYTNALRREGKGLAREVPASFVESIKMVLETAKKAQDDMEEDDGVVYGAGFGAEPSTSKGNQHDNYESQKARLSLSHSQRTAGGEENDDEMAQQQESQLFINSANKIE